jgi:glycosyl transferase family 1
VLHIGNIANNAFFNAKILNQHGFDCDVACPDYYHIMGCPEWEEADFVGSIGDQFRPDWVAVDLRGYERPRWFAQGPLPTCLDYLAARRSGDVTAAERCWEELGVANRTLPPDRSSRAYVRARNRLVWATARRYFTMVIHRPDAPTLARDKLWTWTHSRRWLRPLRYALWPLMMAAVIAVRFLSGVRQSQVIAKWQERFAAEFPDRTDQLETNDLVEPLSLVARWRSVLDLYDIVIGYSTDGIVPLLAGKRYFCLEHGTLREIPYRDTDQGRRTALCYRLSEHVFVTNFDCLDSARRLAPGKFTLINHPFDEDQGLAVTGWEEQRAELQRGLDSDMIFFFPTRHDWVAGTGYADKANDVFLRAFAALRQQGHRVGMVCCAWGANVAQSRALIEELGCSRHVQWTAPLPTVQFERMCRAAHCVVDQFKLGAFGGVMFKAMAVGAPMLTYLDEAQLHRQYPEIPPVINCQTTPEIVAALGHLLDARDELERYGRAARDWMRRHHGKSETVRLQAAQFRHLLFPQAT